MWKPRKVGTIVADRTFTVRRKKGRSGTLRLQIGLPVRAPNAEPADPWWCPVKIGRKTTYVGGVDTLQALVLGLHRAATLLPLLANAQGGDVEWLDQKEKLIFARSFLHKGLENALHSVLDGLVRGVELLSDRPRSVQQQGRKATRALRAIAREVGL